MRNSKFLKTILATSLMAASISVAVAGDMYGSINYAALKGDTGGFGNVKPSVVFGSLGYMVNKNFSVEGRLGGGASDDTVTVLTVPVTVKINHYYGIYLKGIAPLNDTFSVYGLVGGSGAKATASGGGISVSDSNTSGSYGVGMSAAVGKNAQVTLEWARLFKDMDGVSVGVSFKF